MLPNNDEALRFLREFEVSSRDYLKEKGVGEREIANAQLDMQWNLLHTILQQHPLPVRRRQAGPRRPASRKARATIA
ncbi:Hypothetical protein DEACI_3141 [Acididesulfobacillus acetoxydans]|uniref:Uncharacterized protein n=1 Tax=Acididesulfobacillus acetoxydans TaxID=1561005 RepID=A0A8S0XCH7_9FIRM|nr:hypothetical protein [Acididesulfobacillus acetoxydans]CAA7602466.1 Hypothetical protein DEACI_3141 [Acididesulfobacillus acetoxydans]CEJ05921.1 Hypothetical protein DEACI_0341 [Acididesulfobacillus acetoxydans]